MLPIELQIEVVSQLAEGRSMTCVTYQSFLEAVVFLLLPGGRPLPTVTRWGESKEMSRREHRPGKFYETESSELKNLRIRNASQPGSAQRRSRSRMAFRCRSCTEERSTMSYGELESRPPGSDDVWMWLSIWRRSRVFDEILRNLQWEHNFIRTPHRFREANLWIVTRRIPFFYCMLGATV